jgi:hypothetical protein
MHNHDIHSLLIVLIVGFFVAAAALGTLGSGVTGNVVSDEPTVNWNSFLSKIISQNEIKATRSNDVSNSNIGGKAIQIPTNFELKDASCEWLNLDNSKYSLIRGLSGVKACEKLGYNSCLMTNEIKKNQYFESEDSSCIGTVFVDSSNNLGNCDEHIRTVQKPCYNEYNDVQEAMHTSVLCCR